MKKFRAACLIAPVLVACAGCKSPPSRFYTLSAVATPVETTSTAHVSVGPISVPDVVDRPEFVVSTNANEVWLDEFNRWASPLQDNLSRVIAENLVALLGTKRVTLFPSSVTTQVDYRVAVEVQRFETMPGQYALLDAVWIVVRSKDSHTETGRTTQREPVSSAGYGSLAAAHSRAVAVMSADIAQALQRLADSPP